MNHLSRSDFRSAPRRRGVTLVEMLVTVAILVIIMTVLVQVFQAATGAVSGAQAFAQIDDQLRRIDGTIRADLLGVTAHFTPPLDPLQNLGYFEYGENEFADIQGEDSDDYIRFTAAAPPGQPFTGRMWINAWPIPGPNGGYLYNPNAQPVTVSSQYAEIIYFLRNGNLYRRVLLVAPELQSAITPALSYISGTGTVSNSVYLANGMTTTFTPATLGGNQVSWQGMNDLSARPAATGPNGNVVSIPSAAQAQQAIILNSLGDLTNRENRFAYPRFANDFYNISTQATGPDGLADDINQDNVPDLYPTFYPNVFNLSPALINTVGYPSTITAIQTGASLMAFPYVYPGAYSVPQTLSTADLVAGWIHSPSPQVSVNNQAYQFDSNALIYLQNMNHNPLDLGDNVTTPINQSGYVQTWWGFPTWRETLSPAWTDPTYQINTNLTQPAGLIPRANNTLTVADDLNLLPPMSQPASFPSALQFAVFRRNPQLFSDSLGGTSLFWGGQTAGEAPLWASSWEDDLIMTGVRSFDVKAYDNAYGGYADLGWGDDLRLYTPYQNLTGFIGPVTTPPGLLGTPAATTWPPVSPTGSIYNTISQTFAHEGRMPPLVSDGIFDAQFGATTYTGYTYTGNIGDNDPNGVGVVRLRRVWDSWSTEYSRAPGTGVNVGTGLPLGPPFSPPVYPSYPAPYQAPLRGIQIQIRVVDPSNQRIKSLTIVQDFTDKL